MSPDKTGPYIKKPAFNNLCRRNASFFILNYEVASVTREEQK